MRLFGPDRQNDWQEIAKLTPSDPVHYDAFGAALDVSGDTLVIGSPTRDLESVSDWTGTVYYVYS